MSPLIFCFILVSVSLSSIAQIMLKHGMSSAIVQVGLLHGWPDSGFAIISNPFILGGLALYGCGTIVWLLVLAKIDVSMAYPFVSIGFVLTMVLAILALDEPVSVMRVIGTLLIAGGALLVARS